MLGPTPACKVYIGNYAKKCREYAEKFFPDDHVILSAKYGFLFPQEKIPGPYNVSFNVKSTKPVSIELLAGQAKEKGLTVYKRIVVVGGKNYVEVVKSAFPKCEIITPLQGCKGMIDMIQKMHGSIIYGVEIPGKALRGEL